MAARGLVNQHRERQRLAERGLSEEQPVMYGRPGAPDPGWGGGDGHLLSRQGHRGVGGKGTSRLRTSRTVMLSVIF